MPDDEPLEDYFMDLAGPRWHYHIFSRETGRSLCGRWRLQWLGDFWPVCRSDAEARRDNECRDCFRELARLPRGQGVADGIGQPPVAQTEGGGGE